MEPVQNRTTHLPLTTDTSRDTDTVTKATLATGGRWPTLLVKQIGAG